MFHELSEQEELRREKLAELKKIGIDPYPAEEFKINVTAEHEKHQTPGDHKLPGQIGPEPKDQPLLRTRRKSCRNASGSVMVRGVRGWSVTSLRYRSSRSGSRWARIALPMPVQ